MQANQAIEKQGASSDQRHAFKFRTQQGDTALMISEGNRAFWNRYGENITIIGWSE